MFEMYKSPRDAGIPDRPREAYASLTDHTTEGDKA
jgi:hypothetical protein